MRQAELVPTQTSLLLPMSAPTSQQVLPAAADAMGPPTRRPAVAAGRGSNGCRVHKNTPRRHFPGLSPTNVVASILLAHRTPDCPPPPHLALTPSAAPHRSAVFFGRRLVSFCLLKENGLSRSLHHA